MIKRMEIIKRVIAGIFICSLIGVLTISGHAELDESERVGEIAQEELLKIAEEIADDNGSPLAEEIAQSVDGESLMRCIGTRQILTEVLGVTLDSLSAAMRILCLTVGLVILCAVLRRVGEGSGGRILGVELCSSAAFLAVTFTTQVDSLFAVERFFERICALLEGMIPITGAVWAMGGNVSTASVGTAALYGLVSGVGGFCASTVTPVCCIAGISAISSALSGGELLSGFSRAVKKVSSFVIGTLMTILVFVLGTQTALASAADSAAARGAKLVSATVIPVVGGAVGDTLRTVAGSAQYVKSVVGVGGIALILILTLPTLTSLLLLRLALLLSGGAADMMGCPKESRLISELGNIYGLLVGAVSICSVTFCVALGIFVKCAVAGG